MAQDDKKKATEEQEKKRQTLDENDISLLKRYGMGPYSEKIRNIDDENKELLNKINKLCGIKESDTGLALPSQWDINGDNQKKINFLQVARVTKILEPGKKYMINTGHGEKYVVGLAKQVAATDIDVGMRVGVNASLFGNYSIELPLPPKIDPSVTMMQVEEKPDVTYQDIGGVSEQLERLREVVEMPLLNPERFIELGIDPPKGILMYGPPGTGKTLTARAVANKTEATFIRVIGSELVQKYIGEGARLVREIFNMARQKKAAIIFFDEIDSIGGQRSDEGSDNEVSRTMLEIVTQLDGFEERGNIKVIFATNRPDTLDPALMRPGRIDRKVEFGLPDLAGRTYIFKIHARHMSMEKNIRFELLARLCPNCTGADVKSVCTEAGMYAIRERRKAISEKDLLNAIEKVIKGYSKFNSASKYLVYN